MNSDRKGDMVIWKYPLDIVGEQKITTPAVWNPIHVDHQDGSLTLWAEVKLDHQEEVTRTIVIVGTGHSFDTEGLTHIGSSLSPGRLLVWHVYEVDHA